MAEGRMLSKRISRSFKVSTLNSDTARLFFTWLIPYLDVEGRIEADPLLIKADLFPLLDHITVRVINRILRELSDAGLIILYECNGRKYLQLEQFETFQKNLRKDREAPSRIPPPSSGVTPDLLRSDAGPTPAQRKLKEVKIREAKGDTPDLPVDNSDGPKPPFEDNPKNPKPEPEEEEAPPFPGEVKQEPDDQIRTILQGILEKKGFQFHRQCELFVGDHLKNGNRNGIIHCLKGVLKLAEDIESPRAYLEAAFRTEDGNHNAEDHAREAREKSGPSTARGMAAMGKIMARIGRPS